MDVRYNAMHVTSLMTFANIKGSFKQGCKDVYFVRCIGWDEQYLNDIRKIDGMLSGRTQSGAGKYVRAGMLPALAADEDVVFYKNTYNSWITSGKKQLKLKHNPAAGDLEPILTEALAKVSAIFYQYTSAASDSMYMNFMIKMFYWLDNAAGQYLTGWNERESYKFIYNGNLKKQEYLFLYLLTCLGIDVMILCPNGDPALDGGLLQLSDQIKLNVVSDLAIPAYQAQPAEKKTTAVVENTERPRVQIQRSERAPKRTAPVPVTTPVPVPIREAAAAPARNDNQGARELGFEELARMASSVVMIEVRDKSGKPVSTGSGIMIGRQGYILTNHHVIRGGETFCIRIEDDQAIYKTDEVIKYNHVLDMALLRIDRELKPIRVYQGARELARGQKVVAIGSPLGLFNSVSDGIISGFRNINHVEMIQFTAPISHGSSGGAVLNMMGEVIGISTAGFDSGQNINLAVSYKDISTFVQGFIRG